MGKVSYKGCERAIQLSQEAIRTLPTSHIKTSALPGCGCLDMNHCIDVFQRTGNCIMSLCVGNRAGTQGPTQERNQPGTQHRASARGDFSSFVPLCIHILSSTRLYAYAFLCIAKKTNKHQNRAPIPGPLSSPVVRRCNSRRKDTTKATPRSSPVHRCWSSEVLCISCASASVQAVGLDPLPFLRLL